MDETVDLDALALAAAGLVGSDLANMINEAAINAVKKGRKFVNQSDLFDAFELVAVGGKEKKDRIMSEKERKIVSYHEVGHAIVTALQKNTEPVQKITIVPRTMGALGYTLQTPEEEKFLQTKDELLAKITTYMAGRAAEMLVFGSATSGAANDIESATHIARAMVTQYGMSERFGMMCLATVENQYLENRAGLICGEDTAALIDKEVLSIINSCYDEAIRLLTENREVLDHISDYLYEHETITGKEFMKIFRKLKGIPEPEESPEQKKTFFEQAEEARINLEKQTGEASGRGGQEANGAGEANRVDGTGNLYAGIANGADGQETLRVGQVRRADEAASAPARFHEDVDVGDGLLLPPMDLGRNMTRQDEPKNGEAQPEDLGQNMTRQDELKNGEARPGDFGQDEPQHGAELPTDFSETDHRE